MPAETIPTALNAHFAKPAVIANCESVVARGGDQVKTSAVLPAVRRALEPAEEEAAKRWPRQTTGLLF